MLETAQIGTVVAKDYVSSTKSTEINGDRVFESLQPGGVSIAASLDNEQEREACTCFEARWKRGFQSAAHVERLEVSFAVLKAAGHSTYRGSKVVKVGLEPELSSARPPKNERIAA